jgi:hypothetical protein
VRREEARLGALVRAPFTRDFFGIIERSDEESVLVRWEDGSLGILMWPDRRPGQVADASKLTVTER